MFSINRFSKIKIVNIDDYAVCAYVIEGGG